VRNAQRVQARGPALQLAAIAAGEGHMIQAGAMLVEPVTCATGVGVQAEQLSSIKREHGVVEAAGLLVLVENGLGGEQLAVPASASPRSVTVTATWAIGGNPGTAASWLTVERSDGRRSPEPGM
jgi:hypothetical protein